MMLQTTVSSSSFGNMLQYNSSFIHPLSGFRVGQDFFFFFFRGKGRSSHIAAHHQLVPAPVEISISLFTGFSSCTAVQIRVQNCILLKEKLLKNTFSRTFPYKTTGPILCSCYSCCSYIKVMHMPLVISAGTVQDSVCTTVQQKSNSEGFAQDKSSNNFNAFLE